MLIIFVECVFSEYRICYKYLAVLVDQGYKSWDQQLLLSSKTPTITKELSIDSSNHYVEINGELKHFTKKTTSPVLYESFPIHDHGFIFGVPTNLNELRKIQTNKVQLMFEKGLLCLTLLKNHLCIDIVQTITTLSMDIVRLDAMSYIETFHGITIDRYGRNPPFTRIK